MKHGEYVVIVKGKRRNVLGIVQRKINHCWVAVMLNGGERPGVFHNSFVRPATADEGNPENVGKVIL